MGVGGGVEVGVCVWGEEWRWECMGVGKHGIFWTQVEGVHVEVQKLVCVFKGEEHILYVYIEMQCVCVRGVHV